MCCPTNHQSFRQFPMGVPVVNCGCGCVGKEQTVWSLENYREHLKAELASVERQIQAVQKGKQLRQGEMAGPSVAPFCFPDFYRARPCALRIFHLIILLACGIIGFGKYILLIFFSAAF